MFLRFVNPAIVSPYEAGILEKKPLPRIERGLKLMSKVRVGARWVPEGPSSQSQEVCLSLDPAEHRQPRLVYKRGAHEAF